MKRVLREHENAFLFAQTILTIVGLFMTGYTLLSGSITKATVFSAILYLLLTIYTCWGYRKPHGNYLKYLGLLLSFFIVYTGLTVVAPIESQVAELALNKSTDNLLSFLFLLAALGVAYVSGRLNKYLSNTIVLIVVIIVLILAVSNYQGVISETLKAAKATQQIKLANHFVSHNPPILVATYSIAYLIRYEVHIKAGFEEDIKVIPE